MAKLCKLLFLLLSAGCTAQNQPPAKPAIPSVRTGHGFKVDVSHIEAITPERKKRIDSAMVLFENVMNDPAFQAELRSLTFYYDVPDDPLRKLTTQQVVDRLYAAEEFYQPGKDSIATPHWIIRQRNKPGPAIGYADQDEVEFYTFSWVIDQGDAGDIAGVAAHEWSHKLGFQHGFDADPHRQETVTYAFGNLVKKYVKKMLTP